MLCNYNQALAILEQSTILYKHEELCSRIKNLAAIIEQEIQGEIPIFLSIMNGGMFFAAELLKHIKAPLISDYIHASRYRGKNFGSDHITWYRQPKTEDIRNKNIYIVDDILDEGHTLVEVVHFIRAAGAKACKVIVLIDKDIGKSKQIQADYVGFSAPNHLLFGFGMDISRLYRQLPDIYIYNKD